MCNAVFMSRIVQVRLEGPDARPGQIAAADVARVITGLERAMARAAYLVLGRSRRSPSGRHTKAVEAASSLRFVGVDDGSFVELLALPDLSPIEPEFMDLEAQDLSSRAFDRLVSFVQQPLDGGDAELAAAVAQLADELGIGERTQLLTIGEPDQTRPIATIDQAVRRQMRQLSRDLVVHREDAVVGTLFEADFEGQTARLRTSTDGVVTVSYPAEMAGQIHQALRSTSQLEGRITYDHKTGTARSIAISVITRAEQLLLFEPEAEFGENLSIDELQRRQGVAGPVDLASLHTSDWSDVERDAFLSALSTGR